MKLNNSFDTLEDMLSQLSKVQDSGGIIENVVVLARVIDDDDEDEEHLFLGGRPTYSTTPPVYWVTWNW